LGFEILPQSSESSALTNLLEHCMLTGLGVRYWPVGKSKWKFRFKRAVERVADALLERKTLTG
jgi:hypothetical protein